MSRSGWHYPDGDGRATVINLRFPGQYFDQETQWRYNYSRDHDPDPGRYPRGRNGNDH